jgi:hypothetical protein
MSDLFKFNTIMPYCLVTTLKSADLSKYFFFQVVYLTITTRIFEIVNTTNHNYLNL